MFAPGSGANIVLVEAIALIGGEPVCFVPIAQKRTKHIRQKIKPVTRKNQGLLQDCRQSSGYGSGRNSVWIAFGMSALGPKQTNFPSQNSTLSGPRGNARE
jgi:hypothetical protein